MVGVYDGEIDGDSVVGSIVGKSLGFTVGADQHEKKRKNATIALDNIIVKTNKKVTALHLLNVGDKVIGFREGGNEGESYGAYDGEIVGVSIGARVDGAIDSVGAFVAIAVVPSVDTNCVVISLVVA